MVAVDGKQVICSHLLELSETKSLRNTSCAMLAIILSGHDY